MARILVCNFLRDAGLAIYGLVRAFGEVSVVGSCEGALVAIIADRPDLLIVDASTRTELDGIGLIRQVNRGIEKNVPTILVLPGDFQTDQCLIDHPFAPGVAGNMIKPIEPRELVMIVRKILKDQR